MIAPLRGALALPVFRPFFHAFLSTTTLYKIALLLSDKHRESLVMLQDVTVPTSADCKHVDDLCQWLGISPIWLCPVRSATDKQKRIFALDGRREGEMMLNVGLYGKPAMAHPDMRQINYDLERRLAETNGHKALYAFYYGSEQEFWQTRDRQEYTRVRNRYGSRRVFPDLWQKIAYSRQVTS